ncbi:piggyBac transposable element-derived protein 3-like [Nilaparvata lugens]|uniref:piggyBac transposable element-derived protein 3-like n=1 Tax=Nilaparvata lugens TaxID=108931 RepID=UPI00193DF3A0|nr:piggyBac transposable element-derived protein 3-like [Nilaparvata lugens]
MSDCASTMTDRNHNRYDSSNLNCIRLTDLTLQEAIDILECDDADDVQGIFIEPPAPNIDTDEDSGDEDGGGYVDNLTGRQLTSQVEVVTNSRNDTSVLDNTFEDLSSSTVVKNSKKLKKEDWKDEDLPQKDVFFPEPNYVPYRDKSPVELFEMFFDDEIIKLFIDESLKYALFKNCKDPKITSKELKVFLAILFLSGYNQLPSKRSYWDEKKDMRNEIVVDSMRRDRFLEICRFLHCQDNNNINRNDKMWKLRPLMNLLQKKCIAHFQPEENLSFDESMVAYFGKHSCKQFIRGKPIRFGYKVWCLNTVSGYLINFEIYQGKNPFGNEVYEKEFGKCAAPLLKMIDEIPDDKKNLHFKFYCDNLFTSVKLMVHLKERGYDVTGTLRENRVPKECGLTHSKSLKKKERGFYEKRSTQSVGMIVRWVDNSVVTVGSTCYGVEPLIHTQRYCKAAKGRVRVQQPNAIKQYNKFMGGTDRMDENLSYYRIGVRSKKWYWPLLTWMMDVVMHNSWVLARKSGCSISQLDFRREIVNCYLTKFGNPRAGIGRPSISKFGDNNCRVSNDIRLDDSGHLARDCNRRRCAGECKGTVRSECIKCDVGLCLKCFVPFHSK